MFGFGKTKFNPENVPIIIPCCVRPDFLQRTLDFLSQADLIKDFTVYFCIDSKRGESFKPTRTCINLCKDWNMSNKEIYIRNNLKDGTENSTGSIKFLLEKHPEFEAFIYIEEDVIVGRYFLQFCLDCLNKYKNNPYVFGVTGFYRGHKSYDVVGMEPCGPSMVGFCGWRNRIEWSLEKFNHYVKNPSIVGKHLREMQYPKDCRFIVGEFDESLTPKNTAGAGLLLSNQVLDGRITLMAKPSLCDHIGWYGWHFGGGGSKTNSPIVPETFNNRHVCAKTFNIFNNYKLIKADKKLLSKMLDVPVSMLKPPSGLK